MFYKNIRLKIIYFAAFIIFCKIGLVSGDEVDYESKGFTAYANEDYKTAIEMFKKEIQIHPNNFMAYYLLGDSYISGKDFNEALHYFYKGIKINPTNPSLLFGIAGILCDHYGSGPLQNVKQCLEISLKAASLSDLNKFSNAPYFYTFIIDSYIAQTDYAKAKKWANKLLKVFPEAVSPPDYYLNKINTLEVNIKKELSPEFKKKLKELRKERIKRIEEEQKKVTNTYEEPFYVTYFNEIAMLSLLFLALAAIIFRLWYPLYLFAGNRHFKAGRYEEAVGYYEKLLYFRRGKFVPYDKLKEIYLQLDRKDEKAIFVFEKIYKENPEDREVIAALASVYSEKNVYN